MTFSIVARCPDTAMLGGAVSTAVPAVGAICLFGAPGAGFVSTQSWVNPYFGIDGVAMLRQGASADEVLARLLDGDPGRAMRQLGIVDARGHSVAHTGEECTDWSGHLTGPYYSIQGNMLTGPGPLSAMEESFQNSAGEPLPERLVRALEAGQTAGGDKRGRQSAALKVFSVEEYPYLDVRVDEHSQPVAELRRVFDVASRQLLPFIRMMPTREDPIGGHDKEVEAYILLSPEERERRPAPSAK
jgi:uncharacterized Ntn-hydrolase superfamily protein